MENNKKGDVQNAVNSIGCVMCATNFTWQDDQNTIVTRCGHLYHKECLEKWFDSMDSLNPIGVYTCPDCRSVIGDADIKPVYMHYTSSDDIQSHLVEMKRQKEESQQLKSLLTQCTIELKKIQQELTSEKAKYKRLTTKHRALEKKFEVAKQKSCPRCTSSSSSGQLKITTTKKSSKVTTLQVASVGTQKHTKILRSREYTYSI
ncbi:E3 ubiquitin-protein ligase TRAIP-like [Contarinia nasturtii]|uniref:E3 ubiquitin-protein ligase TRAIP-like n=1 Tax=Contarinia nasturtii TaxID=265458 RepID=UPI0012D4911E|nr:E3 ubiquitin-protein ligase TRAIP-like [Contarinia nasturtii]